MMKVILIVALCVLVLSDFGSSKSLGPLHRGIRSADETSSAAPSADSVTEAVADETTVAHRTTRAPAHASSKAEPAAPALATPKSAPSVEVLITVKQPAPAEASSTEVPSTTSASEVPSTTSASEVPSTTSASEVPSTTSASEASSSEAPSSTTARVAEVSSSEAPSSTTARVAEAASDVTTASPAEASSTVASPQSDKSNPEISTSLVKEEPEPQSAETSPDNKETPNAAPETVSENQENRLDTPAPEQPSVQPISAPPAASGEKVMSTSLVAPTVPGDTPVVVSIPVIQQPASAPADEVPAPQTALLERDPPVEASNADFVVLPAQDIRVDGVTAGSVVSDGVPQSPEQSVEIVSIAPQASVSAVIIDNSSPAGTAGDTVLLMTAIQTSGSPASEEPKIEAKDANKKSDASSPAPETQKAAVESVEASSPASTPVAEKALVPKSVSVPESGPEKKEASSKTTSAAPEAAPAAQTPTTPTAPKTTEAPVPASTEGAKSSSEAEKSSTPSP